MRFRLFLTCFNMLNASMLFWLSLDEKPNSLHKSGDFSSCIICAFAREEISNYKNPNSGI